MSCFRTYRFLLQPTSRQRTGLEHLCLGQCELYNAALEEKRGSESERLLPAKLAQPFIAYSEVVTDLVDHGLSHRDYDLFLGVASAADWILVDGDAVRKSTGVIPAFCERYPLVEAQGVVSVPPILDHDGDVGHFVSEFGRDGVQRVGDQLLESVARDGSHRFKVAVRSQTKDAS